MQASFQQRSPLSETFFCCLCCAWFEKDHFFAHNEVLMVKKSTNYFTLQKFMFDFLHQSHYRKLRTVEEYSIGRLLILNLAWESWTIKWSEKMLIVLFYLDFQAHIHKTCSSHYFNKQMNRKRSASSSVND